MHVLLTIQAAFVHLQFFLLWWGGSTTHSIHLLRRPLCQISKTHWGQWLPRRLMMPSLYAAKSRIASLKRSMKAALITPLVSSLALTWWRGRVRYQDRHSHQSWRHPAWRALTHSHWSRATRPSDFGWWGWSWAVSLYSWFSSLHQTCHKKKDTRLETDC